MSRVFWPLFLVVAMSAFVAPANALEVVFDRLFARTDPVEGLSAPYDSLGLARAAYIGDQGIQVTAILSGPGITDANKYVNLLVTPTGARMLGRSGSPVPNPPGNDTFDQSFYPGNLNDALSRDTGNAALIVSSTDNSWLVTEGQLRLLAAEGYHVPGFASDVLFGAGAVVHELARSTVAMTATINGPSLPTGSRRGILVGNLDGLRLVVDFAIPVAGPNGPVKFSYADFYRTNQRGDLAIMAAPAGVEGPHETQGIWRVRDGQAAPVATYGQQAPGLPAGLVYSPFSASPLTPQLSLSDAGELAFPIELSGLGVTTANNIGFYSTLNGVPTLLARGGIPAPGAGGASFGTLSGLTNIQINATGQLAFTAPLAGSGVTSENNLGLWAGSPGQLRLLARKGDLAPGIATGVRINHFEPPLLNNDGLIAFLARLTGEGVTTSNDYALYAYVDGQLAMLAREGSFIDVDPTSDAPRVRVGDFGLFQIGTGRRLLLSEDGVIGFGGMGIVSARMFNIGADRPDFDADGDVDAADLTRWRTGWGAGSPSFTTGDSDGDGDADGTDFLHWQRSVGSMPQANAIPEPGAATTGVLCVAAMSILRRARKSASI